MSPNVYQQGFTGPDHRDRSVRGIRFWTRGHLGYLVGSWGKTWHPGMNEASCFPIACDCSLCVEAQVLETPHQVADPKCSCGFYAFFSSTFAPPLLYGIRVFGVIEGYGHTTIGTKGFRSAKARVLALSAVNDTQGGLSAEYGVPVFRSMYNMLAEFPTSEPGDY